MNRLSGSGHHGKGGFVSRGDNSGTDALEHRLWRVAGTGPATAGGGSWYRDIVGGMGAALNAAQAMNAYTISVSRHLAELGQQGRTHRAARRRSSLLNRYDVILLNPAKHPAPKQALASRFAQWPVSPEGKQRSAHMRLTASSCSTHRRRPQGEEYDKKRKHHENPAGDQLWVKDGSAPGNVVTVKRIDRLARSTFDQFGIVKRIVDARAQSNPRPNRGPKSAPVPGG